MLIIVTIKLLMSRQNTNYAHLRSFCCINEQLSRAYGSLFMPEDFLDISNILNHVITLHGISEAELSRQIGVPRATINRLVSGRTPDPRASTLKAIAEFFNISVDQLLGKQPLFLGANQSMIATVDTSLPIIDWNQAENWQEVVSRLKPDNHFNWTIADPSHKKGSFALRLNGESMWPQFQEKTILIIEPTEQVKNKDFVIAYIKKNDEIIFRQLTLEGKYKFLKAFNPMFPTIQMGDEDKIIGVVIQTKNTYD